MNSCVDVAVSIQTFQARMLVTGRKRGSVRRLELRSTRFPRTMSFNNAPISKGLMIALAATSIGISIFDIKYYLPLQV